MKKLTQIALFGFALTFILSSCSLEKRQYMPGYYISWSNGNRSSAALVKNNLSHSEKTNNGNKVQPNLTDELPETSIDSGSEAGDNSISASAGKSIFIPAAQKFNLSKSRSTKLSTDNNQPSETKTIIKEQKKDTKKTVKKNAHGMGGESQLIALLLCVFLGVFGIHRFYLGYFGIGVLMLLTGGVCGILVLIDFIRIITGDLKPIDGDYTDKL